MKILHVITMILLSSCVTQNPKYIQGYIYTTEHNPIERIKIQDPNNTKILSYTNSKGYFRINQMIKGRLLYVLQNNKKIDSIYIITTHPEKGANYNFVEGRKDTLFINLNKITLPNN